MPWMDRSLNVKGHFTLIDLTPCLLSKEPKELSLHIDGQVSNGCLILSMKEPLLGKPHVPGAWPCRQER